MHLVLSMVLLLLSTKSVLHLFLAKIKCPPPGTDPSSTSKWRIGDPDLVHRWWVYERLACSQIQLFLLPVLNLRSSASLITQSMAGWIFTFLLHWTKSSTSNFWWSWRDWSSGLSHSEQKECPHSHSWHQFQGPCWVTRSKSVKCKYWLCKKLASWSVARSFGFLEGVDTTDPNRSFKLGSCKGFPRLSQLPPVRVVPVRDVR